MRKQKWKNWIALKADDIIKINCDVWVLFWPPDPSGRAGLCFVYQKPNMADTEFQEFLNCQNHDGSIFIKIMLCIFFSVNKMHQVYFQKVHLQKLSEKKKYQHTLCVKRKEGKRLCMPDIKKKRWSVDRGALTIPQGGTLYQARSDLLQTILAISKQFIHRLGNVFCHFINKQRWWSFSDYAGKSTAATVWNLPTFGTSGTACFLFLRVWKKPGWVCVSWKKKIYACKWNQKQRFVSHFRQTYQ